MAYPNQKQARHDYGQASPHTQPPPSPVQVPKRLISGILPVAFRLQAYVCMLDDVLQAEPNSIL
eukprot:1191015-Prorocentrum_minimum.AAC.2